MQLRLGRGRIQVVLGSGPAGLRLEGEAVVQRAARAVVVVVQEQVVVQEHVPRALPIPQGGRCGPG